MDDADRLARWARTRLKVPAGLLQGKPYRLEPWQVDWLRGAMAPGKYEAGLSTARKNGKTGMMVVPTLGYLAGELMTPQWRAVVVSETGGLAKEFRGQVEDTARASGLYDTDAESSRRRPEPGKIVVQSTPAPGRIIGAAGRVDILAADRATGHAVGADLAMIDEGGLLREQQRGLWNAIQSCTSGRNGRMWVFSIIGDGPMFRELRDRQHLDSVFWRQWSAPPGAAIDDEEAWRAANPGLGTIKSLDYMRARVAAVLSSPADQAFFRAHELNQPQAPGREQVCTPEEWAACEVETLPPREGPASVAFDLGGGESMTAGAAYWPATGRLELRAVFPEVPDLLERGRRDNVGTLYQQMAERGELGLSGRRVVDVGAFLQDFAKDVPDVATAAADSFRREEAEDALENAGVTWPMDWRANMSGSDGSHDLREFQRAVHEGRIRCLPLKTMREALLWADVKRIHAAEHPTLGKAKSRARIDVLAAAVLAVGIASGGGAADLGSFILTEMYQ